jgi:hypothetical protein
VRVGVKKNKQKESNRALTYKEGKKKQDVFYIFFVKMPGTRRGLVAPQNNFLESIIRRCNGSRKLKFFFP